MKAVYIYPEDIGVSTEYNDRWINFIMKFGYTTGTPWSCVLLTSIEIEN